MKEITLQTRTVLEAIANIQCNALRQIIENPKANHQDFVKAFNIKEEDIVSTAEHYLHLYEYTKEHPWYYQLTTEPQLLICIHILFQMEEQWIQENQEGVQGAWKHLLTAMNRFHPEYQTLLWT